MVHVRAYVGPFVLILYLSFWIIFVIFNDEVLSDPRPIHTVLFIASLAVLSAIYITKVTLPQKQFVRVSGEVLLCFFVSALVSVVFLILYETYSSILSYVVTLLLLLVYHFIINKRTLEDFSIKEVSQDTEFLVVSAIGLFSLYGVINFQLLLEKGAPHFPAFERLVTIFLVVVAEEIAYRYYIQKAGEEAFGTYGTVLATTILISLTRFVVRPFEVLPFVYFFVSHLTFGYGYARGKNLAVPLILHFVAATFPAWFF